MAPIEKRLERTRSKFPKKLEGHLQRAMAQQMIVVKEPVLRKQWQDVLEEERDFCQKSKKPAKATVCPTNFAIAGSTGNKYTVTLDIRPTCTCPDFAKGDVCKHILFVLLKVVLVPRSSSIWYQRAYLTTELIDIYRHLQLSLKSGKIGGVSPDIQAACEQVMKSPQKTGTRCSQCHGRFGVEASSAIHCPSSRCGGIFHHDCLNCESMPDLGRLSLEHQRPHSSSKSNKNRVRTTIVTCPRCYTTWEHDAGYVNLAHVTGQTPIRDKSTYRPTPGYPGYTPCRPGGYY